ncbi:hypothetical protein EVG20_g5286 [Dentipellis fragilis]|uniref:Uncharacterized protein n=1 Tax=Dentipellis fragilis TaxID=205917 RepID=A0A4Y9YVV9_9AGAM|nr:hypothetical protein EVG20_g5286 [Dentipellis fragilis]
MSSVSATSLQSFLGGLGLTFPVHALLTLNGSIFGISGFMHRAVMGRKEDAASVLGLVLGGLLIGKIDGLAPVVLDSSPLRMIASGLLVGLGTKLSNGCTSGHMLCGLSRFSLRSAVAVATFFTTGVITAHALHSGSLAPVTDYLNTQLESSSGYLLAFSALSSLAAVAISQRNPSPDTPVPTKNTNPTRRVLTSLLTAVSFALSLRLSNLTEPTRVLSFLMLPPNPAFDPSLAFLAVGAIPLLSLLYRKYGKPYTPTMKKDVDGRLVVGAALFGVGWGIQGICPGPGLVNFGRALTAGVGIQPLAIWLSSIIIGGLVVP